MNPPADSNLANPGRRQWLLGGSVAALAAAAGATVRSGLADEPEETPDSAPAVDVRRFGARGDGVHDDAEALARAIDHAAANRLPRVALPAGTFLVSRTLRLPSNLTLAGAGSGLSTLLAAEGARFDLVRPDPRTPDVRQRRALLATAAAGSAGKECTRNLAIRSLSVDWNHAPTAGFGSACILIDSAENVLLHDVAFLRAMPADHPRSIDQMQGSAFRCECILFSNARHALMDFCYLVDSGYRPLSAAYGSLDVTFQNGVIRAVAPVWRHAFAENHGDGLPRDERFVHSQLKLLNSTFVLEGGTAQDGICSHTGTTHVENCDFHIRGGTRHFGWVLKPFDGSKQCTYVNNRFHCDHAHDNLFGVVGTIGRAVNRDLVFTGNLIHVSFAEKLGGETGRVTSFAETGQRGLIDFGVAERRLTVRDNHVVARYAGPAHAAVIRLAGASQFSVTGNQIDVEAAAARPDGVLLADSHTGVVSGNVVAGDCRAGIRRRGTVAGVETTHNAVGAGVETPFLEEDPSTVVDKKGDTP
jgi:hypothetical protein